MAEDRFTSKFDAEKVRQAAILIHDGFLWRESSEGNDFWLKIRNRLLEIAEYKPKEEPILIEGLEVVPDGPHAVKLGSHRITREDAVKMLENALKALKMMNEQAN